MFFLQVPLNLHFSLEMIDHHIMYILFNERIICESMAFMFVETITINYKYEFINYTLVKSTPYPFSKLQYMFCWFFLTFDSLVCKTLALVVVFIFVWIIVIGGVL
jgi:hypothetical protein